MAEQVQSSPPVAPVLSIIVASSQASNDLAGFLEALTGQVRGEWIEIIVAGCQQSDIQESVAARYPDVAFIQFPENTTLPVLFGAGISRSTGQVIALTDAACKVSKHWVGAILEAHNAPAPIIGGAVEMNDISRLVDWAAYFCEYGQFMLPMKEGPATEIPGNNLSFKRWLLSKGKEYTQDGFWKTYWCRKLQEEGIELELRPSVVVYYTKSFELLPFLVRRFHHGRCFSGMRLSGSSFSKSAAFAAGSILLPFIFFMRTIARVLPKRRHLLEFTLSLPITVLAIVFWSAGEFCGYLTGTGKSCAHVV
jgi:hypothetical protein